METFNIFLRVMGASQMLLFILLLIPSKNPLRVRIVGCFLMLGVISYLMMPIFENEVFFKNIYFLYFPANIAPSLLLMFVWFIFEDRTRIPLWLIAMVVTGILSSLWYMLQLIGFPHTPLWVQAFKIVILFVSVAIVWIGRDHDLLELRSKARFMFVANLAVIMLIIVTIQTLTDLDNYLLFDTLEVSIVFLFTLIGNFLFVRLNPQFQLMAEAATIKTDSDDPIIKELLAKMKTERLYADHDLRVASLAAMMNIPEYRLRSKINQQLGYRNFNQFVNRYRIEEAGEKLLKDTRLPILSIALDVGFRSISSFNTAFQAQFGVSPTQFRSDALTDS